MSDNVSSRPRSHSPVGSATGHFAVTPHDSTNFTTQAYALYVGGAGNIVIVDPTGTAVTYVGVPAGSILPVRCNRVNDTDTTATNIVGLY